MTIFEAIVLGAIQGATEFVPVSSTAHLVLVPWLLGWRDPSFEYDVLVQWGTLVAVIAYFWRDLWRIARSMLSGLASGNPLKDSDAQQGWLLLVAALPAVVVGFSIKAYIESAFNSPRSVAGLLLITAVMLVTAEHLSRRAGPGKAVGWRDALVIGCWQALALLPGISRSGSTISGGMLRGLSRETAARFSFLMSVPVMFGAGIVALGDLAASDWMAQLPSIVIGSATAAVVGFIVIRWLLHYLGKRSMNVFAAYCALVGIGCFVISFVR